MEDIYKLKSPCNTCPFNKKVKPGELGGSHPMVYIEQIHGPYWLPCHSHTNYKDPNWKRDFSKPQCAGAAIFRANLQIDNKMPEFLHHLPASNQVFKNEEEFLLHHLLG